MFAVRFWPVGELVQVFNDQIFNILVPHIHVERYLMPLSDWVEGIFGTVRVEQYDGTTIVLDRIPIPIIARVYKYVVMAIGYGGY